ncbi:MAG: hypothetical protein LBJ00_08010, partial [Planctomycetaceae bacterium]|nr:hypothetical protein [Planctomycetaceae bacterium]
MTIVWIARTTLNSKYFFSWNSNKKEFVILPIVHQSLVRSGWRIIARNIASGETQELGFIDTENQNKDLYSSCFKIHGAGHSSVASRSGCSRANPIAHTGSGIITIFGRISMGHFSKDKGKRGERELAVELNRVLGIFACRGVQYQGSPNSPDIITSLPDIHIECKRAERLQLYKALQQSIIDAGKNKIPIVCHRQNKQPWVVIIRLDDLPKLTSTIFCTKNERTKHSRDFTG